MKYGYYKDKYRSISIKLDQVKDADVIQYLDKCSAKGYGPKAQICGLIRQQMAYEILIMKSGLFRDEEVKPFKDPEVESDG